MLYIGYVRSLSIYDRHHKNSKKQYVFTVASTLVHHYLYGVSIVCCEGRLVLKGLHEYSRRGEIIFEKSIPLELAGRWQRLERYTYEITHR